MGKHGWCVRDERQELLKGQSYSPLFAARIKGIEQPHFHRFLIIYDATQARIFSAFPLNDDIRVCLMYGYSKIHSIACNERMIINDDKLANFPDISWSKNTILREPSAEILQLTM